MIGFLEGEAIGEDLVLSAAGVGFEVGCARPLEVGTAVRLWVHTVVRENAVALYGFDSEAERAVFRSLVAVGGVGPSAALALLRDVGAAALEAAVRAKDHRALCAAQGVGPKLAERIVAMVSLPDGVVVAEQSSSVVAELTAALVALGYTPGEAGEAASATVAGLGEDADEGALVVAALARLRGAQ